MCSQLKIALEKYAGSQGVDAWDASERQDGAHIYALFQTTLGSIFSGPSWNGATLVCTARALAGHGFPWQAGDDCARNVLAFHGRNLVRQAVSFATEKRRDLQGVEAPAVADQF